MYRENTKENAKDVIEHINTENSKINLISFCCVLMVTLLIIITGVLCSINKNINNLIDLIEDGEYNRVAEIFHEEKTPEDILPILGVTSTTENNCNIETEIVDNEEVETTTQKSNNNSTSTNNKQEISTKNNTTTTETTKSQSKTNTYVINKSSKKVHTKDCSFVDRMKDENKQTVQLTKEELNNYLNNGYTACSSCGG